MGLEQQCWIPEGKVESDADERRVVEPFEIGICWRLPLTSLSFAVRWGRK